MRLKIFIIVFLSIISFPLFAQDAETIVEKHLEISGGTQNWQNLNSIILKGQVIIDVDNTYSMVIYHKRPFMKRVVFILNGKEILSEGYDGKDGYTYSEIAKKNVVVPKYQPEAFDSDLLMYKKKGFDLKYLGKQSIDGEECYKVMLTKNKNTTTYYISTKDYQLIAEEDKEETLFYSKYKKIGNLSFAMEILGKPKKGGEYRVLFTEIKTNPTIDDKLFKF